MNEILSVFKSFDKADVQYCLLRNYEDLLTQNINRDIDILAQPKNRKIIVKLFRAAGWTLKSGDTTRQSEFVKYIDDFEKFVKIDVYWGAATYNGLDLIDGKRVLENRKQHRDFWIPSNEDYFVGLLFHSVLNKNRIKDEYRGELEKVAEDVNRKEVVQHAESLFGEAGIEAVRLALNGEYDPIPVLKWKLIRARLIRSPVATVTVFWNLIVLRKIIRPCQNIFSNLNPLDGTPVIAVVGPDGVGKSTAVENTVTQLNRDGIDARSCTLGVHSGISPFLKTVKRIYHRISVNQRSNKSNAGKNESVSIPSRSSRLKAPVLLLDFAIRFMKVQRSSADIIVADRYIHELVVYSKLGPIKRAFSLFEPTGFYGVILVDSPERVAMRSEFDHKSINEFYTRLNPINWHRIDVSEGPTKAKDLLTSIARNVLSMSS